MEKALFHVRAQLQSPEVDFTLNAIDSVANYLLLLREFPIQDLLAATTFAHLQNAVRLIFAHMKKLKAATAYPLARAFQLAEAISRDLKAQILKILSTQRWMALEYAAFEEGTRESEKLFRVWDEEVRAFKEMVRDQVKRRGTSERPPHKIVCEHQALQDRVDDVRLFRRQHKKMEDVLAKIFPKAEARTELSDAFAVFVGSTSGAGAISSRVPPAGGGAATAPSGDAALVPTTTSVVDVLDTSAAGTARWEAARKKYNEKIDKLETVIITKLRDQLGAARSADDMFASFQKFNALFFRSRIRGAIQEYQSTLLENVRMEVGKLQLKFKEKFEQSKSARVTLQRDIPPLTGAVLWARQIERKLHLCLKRVEDVLGRGWEQHVDGGKIKQTVDAFLQKCSAVQLFEQWMRDVKEHRPFDMAKERLFAITVQAKNYELTVNTDTTITTLFKEVRNLQAMQFRVPYSLKVMADEARLSYPVSNGLEEACRTYMQVTQREFTPTVELLMAQHHADVQGLIQQGMGLRWINDKVEGYARKLCEEVNRFQERVSEVSSCAAEMEKLIAKLDDYDVTEEAGGRGAAAVEPGPVSPGKIAGTSTQSAQPDGPSGVAALDLSSPRGYFKSILAQMQALLDDMNLKNYSNLEYWAQEHLHSKITSKLKKVLLQLIDTWTRQFQRWPNAGTSLIETATVHELRMSQQLLALSPPKESARQFWVQHFHSTLGIICSLPQLAAQRLDSVAAVENAKTSLIATKLREASAKTRNYNFLLAEVPERGFLDAYDAIEAVLAQMGGYANAWLQYQALWDISADSVFEKLGDDLSKWQQLLAEIKSSRLQLETQEAEKSFGPMTVDHSKVSTKILSKYDLWRRDILHEFGERVYTMASQLVGELRETRHTLEKASFEPGKPSTMKSITTVQHLKQRRDEMQAQVAQILDCTKTLVRNKGYSFPDDFPTQEQQQSDWDSLSAVLERKAAVMEREMPSLKAGIERQEKTITAEVRTCYADWTKEKPVHTVESSAEALIIVRKYEEKVERLREECGQMGDAIGCVLGRAPGALEQQIQPLVDEIQNLKEVWSALGAVEKELDKMKETPWSAVVPKRIRATLDEELLQNRMKQMPDRVQQYDSYGAMLDKI
eukprot:g9255.t1